MNSCTLNELHDSRNKYVDAIADCVNLKLLACDVLIYKYRLVLVDLYCSLEVMSELSLACNNLHCSSSKNE